MMQKMVAYNISKILTSLLKIFCLETFLEKGVVNFDYGFASYFKDSTIKNYIYFGIGNTVIDYIVLEIPL